MAKIIFGLSILYSLVVFFIFPKWTADDAYISFRYAENLARHGALTWNVGEDPIEGYTGVAWPVILAAFIKLGFSPMIVSQGIGVISFALGGLFLFLALRRLRVEVLASSLTLLLYATTPILFTHALSGMEAMLFVSSILASLCALIYALAAAEARRDRSEVVLFIALLFTSLARPEGVALAALFIVAVGYDRFLSGRKDLRKFALRFLYFYFIPAAIYFYWRVSYYGQLLPNTYYAKTLATVSPAILADIARFWRRFFAVPLFAVLFLLIAEIDFIWQKLRGNKILPQGKKLLPALAAGILFVGIITAQLGRSHLIANFSHRFYLPFLPFIWLAFGVGLSIGLSVLKNFKADKPLRHKLGVSLIILLIAYQASFQVSKIKEEIRFARDQIAIHENQHNAIGRWLKETVPSGEWLIVYIDAGAVPYFSQLKTVDFGRLNDEFLVRPNLSLVERTDYFYSFNPGALVFTSFSLDRVNYGKEAAAITADPRFANYVLARKAPSPLSPPAFHELVFLRKDLAAKLK